MGTRDELARRLGGGAAWRAAQSAERPEDQGNRRSADALGELAGYVMTLPPDDRRFDAIAGLSFDEHTFPGADDEVDQLIVRYGSNRHLQSHPETFLRELVGIADRKAHLSRGSRWASAKASEALRRGPGDPEPSKDSIASDLDPSAGGPGFDPSGGFTEDPSEGYGGLSKWDFRPPHPIGDGPITEMVLERGL